MRCSVVKRPCFHIEKALMAPPYHHKSWCLNCALRWMVPLLFCRNHILTKQFIFWLVRTQCIPPPHQNVAEAQRRQGCFSMLFMCFFLHVELQSFNLTAKINCAHTQWLSEVLFSLGSYFHHRIRLCFWHSAAWGPGNHNQLIGFLASYNETSLITWIF